MNKTALNSQKEKHSMLSLRRATFVGLAAHRLRNISIHALLAESDADNGDAGNGCDAISIHALLAESDYWLPVRHSRTEAFLSTLSLRRATAAEHRLLALNSISIHALLAESDIDLRNIIRTRLVFLSTLSLRRATQVHRYRLKNHHYFYPRSPCGERLTVFSIFQVVIIFLSTLSLRRATSNLASDPPTIGISIHALLAESDPIANNATTMNA